MILKQIDSGLRCRAPLSALLIAAAVAWHSPIARAATITVGGWTQIFQGIDLASGQQQAVAAGEKTHQALCLRVDLTDPGVQLFTTPHCTNGCSLETLAENTSHFVEQHGLQAAVNGQFFGSSSGPSDTPLGTADDVLGLAISRGAIVSPANTAAYAATLLFTTNKTAFFAPTNSPATNTAGIYTAISGNYPLLIRGVNVGVANANDLDPRTAVGLSEDKRYLFLMTIDGRQAGWSDGADFYNTGEWLKRFGAYDGINVDGGGSTTMVIADCAGSATRLNRSSFVAAYGRERNIGHNFGVTARPLATELKEFTVIPGTTTATLTWRTEEPATAQVEYGATSAYGSSTPLDSRMLTRHAVTLNGLTSGNSYYFRATSIAGGGQQRTQACRVTTTTSFNTAQAFGLNQSWKYTTNSLDGTNWTARSYNDSGWMGSGPGLLYVLETSASVSPKGAQMPPTSGNAIPRTYYFRTHFNFSGSSSGASLIFSNYVDDGAVFYLNGAEIYRLRMPAIPTVITATTFASGTPCAGTAQAGDAATICPDIFTIGGSVLTNLVEGDNVIAVETHNYSTGADLVFGSALIVNTAALVAPQLNALLEGGHGTLYWNAEGLTLQQSDNLSSPANWTNVTDSVTRSPFAITNPGTRFYRLKN